MTLHQHCRDASGLVRPGERSYTINNSDNDSNDNNDSNENNGNNNDNDDSNHLSNEDGNEAV